MNDELRALFEEDRADTQAFRGDESFLASQARLGRVSYLLNMGEVQTVEDFYHAGCLFQHGERLEHWEKAQLLSQTAAELGHPKARYQAAAAYDRWLMRQGKPQKYGTNSTMDGDRWRVWDYDPTTTDEERAEWDVPPLKELLERGERAFGGLSVAQIWSAPLATVVLNGLKIEILEADPTPPKLPSSYGIPNYEPLNASDPKPQVILRGRYSFWRFGKLFCAKQRRHNQVVFTWHPCCWRLANDSDPQAAEALYVQIGQQPQWLSGEDAFWQRLGIATSPTTCWIVGGQVSRETLEAIALGLIPVTTSEDIVFPL